MDKAQKKVALVGLGAISPFHIKGIKEAGYQLVAVCDTNADARKACRAGKVKKYESLDKMLDALKGQEPDYIVLATPPDTHMPLINIAQAACPNSKILVEKPLAPLDTEIEQPLSPNVHVMYHWPFGEEVMWLKEQIKKEDITKVEISIHDPYLTRSGNIRPKLLSSKVDCWTDSGANALSYLAQLVDISKAQDIQIKHHRLDIKNQRPIETTCTMTVDNTDVCIHIEWTESNTQKRSTITTQEHIYQVDHSSQKVFEGEKRTRVYQSDSKHSRLENHYINLYQHDQPDESNMALTQHIRRIMQTKADVASIDHQNRLVERYVQRHSNRRQFERFSLLKWFIPTSILIAVVAAFFIVFWGNLEWRADGKDFLVNLVASVIGVLASYGLLWLIERLHRHNEDRLKVEYDESVLREQYGDHYLKRFEVNHTEASVYYDCLFDSREHKGCKIRLEDHPEQKFELDNFIRFQYFSIRSAHASDAFTNKPTIRLKDAYWSKDKQTFQLVTERSNYLAHMLTNRAIDYKMNDMASLRQLFEYTDTLTELKDSKFSNHIGLNALIIIGKGNQRYVLLPQRGSKATISKHFVTASIAARLETNDYTKEVCPKDAPYLEQSSLTEVGPFTKRLLTDSMAIDEHVLRDSHLSGMNIQLLGIGRDIHEGGKPTLFYRIELPNLSLKEYMDMPFYKNKSVDEVARIFAIPEKQLQVSSNAICVTGWCRAPHGRLTRVRQLKHVWPILPEKNLLALLWHIYNR